MCSKSQVSAGSSKGSAGACARAQGTEAVPGWGAVAVGPLPWPLHAALREEPWGYPRASSHAPHGKFLLKNKPYTWEGHRVGWGS